MGAYGPCTSDRAFIAAARTDVPALVAEVRRLRALIGAWGAEASTAEIRYYAGEAVVHTTATDAMLTEAARILDGTV
jgi:hypothetical protein